MTLPKVKMKEKYKNYIVQYQNSTPLFRKYKEACFLMQKQFPELKIVSGHVHPYGKDIVHYWLVDLDGNIVDPTSKQFSKIQDYQPFVSGPVNVGKCPYSKCKKDLFQNMQYVDDKIFLFYCNDMCKSNRETEDFRNHFWNPDELETLMFRVSIIGLITAPVWIPVVIVCEGVKGVKSIFAGKNK
jgi:hypothetical protein